MAYIDWNENLSVKVSSIDAQHKKLFELINDFYDNIQNRSNDESILCLINGMKQYTQTHFTTEEKYMEKYNYPDYDTHKSEHNKFIEKVSAIEEKYKNGKLILSFEITGLLKDWLKNHIQIEDKKYSDFFVKNGVR
jgi:hemerythrin-like metal-binding protein